MSARSRPAHTSRLVVAAAAGATIAIGLAFVFVRAPHPWGWEGFDHYHELALSVARGEGFPTMDRPWGYAYFLAAFYRVAGNRPWVPLTAQVLLNGLTPVLVYQLVRRDLGETVALTSAVLTGLLSFNTVYVSTQASDGLCTVCFLASLVLLARGFSTERFVLFAVSGFLAGLSAQFRPNLLLFPGVAAAAAWIFERRSSRLLRALSIYVALAVAANAPWIVRNLRVSGEFIPSSTHGGQQLWYGTLQTGPYLTSRAYNPRSVFEAASFDYSSLSNRPLMITAEPRQCAPGTQDVRLAYWTDRDARVRDAGALPEAGSRRYVFEIPGQQVPTAVYYYFTSTDRTTGTKVTTPAAAAKTPNVFFVDDHHLSDLDRHGDLVDGFDFIRMVRALAWREPLPFADRLDLNNDGRVTEDDLQLVGRALRNAGTGDGTAGPDVIASIATAPDHADVRFVDGSTLYVSHVWNERITDVLPRGNLAEKMTIASTRWSSLPDPHILDDDPKEPCRQVKNVRINDMFYRREPHMMRRYTALAFDNIRRDPAAFVQASAYRAVRLFVVDGTTDSWTTQQFEGSRPVYVLASLASSSYLLAAVIGVVIAVRRRIRVWLLLVPILYVPVTICYALTNMRYSVTVQPLLFAFMAVALTSAAARWRRPAQASAGAETARS